MHSRHYAVQWQLIVGMLLHPAVDGDQKLHAIWEVVLSEQPRPVRLSRTVLRRVGEVMQPIFKHYQTEREIPQTVKDALKKAYGHDHELYMNSLRCVQYDFMNQCWCIGHCGMYIGIEEADGHMHT